MANQDENEFRGFKQETQIKIESIKEKLTILNDNFNDHLERTIETEKDIVRLDGAIKSIKERIEQLVSKDEFSPIRALVYGMVGMALTGVLSAVLAKIITK